MIKKEELEITRNNCTPAQFLAYVRSQIRKKGLTAVSVDEIDMDYWKAGNDLNFPLHTHDGITEYSKSAPYEEQTYVRRGDIIYNFILEFNFWDEKTGNGYFYFINTWKEG